MWSKLESLWECEPKLNTVMLAVGLEHTWHNVAHQGGWTDERPCLHQTIFGEVQSQMGIAGIMISHGGPSSTLIRY